MTLQSRLLWRSTSARAATRAIRTPCRFSTHAIRQTGQEAHDSSASGNKNSKSRGSYSRVFLAFAVGVPLGFGVHILNQRSKDRIHSSSTGFIGYSIVDKQTISSTSSIFSLFPSGPTAIDTADPLLRRAVTSVQFKQPQLQIARWYTVLPRDEGQEEHELRFLIRKEQNGEVSGYLHRLPVDASIELRGPSADYLLPERVSKVIFLAGGTGIAPAMCVADILSGEAEMQILWANRQRQDCKGGISDTKTQVVGWRSILPWSSSSSSSSSPTPNADAARAPMDPMVKRLESLKARARGAQSALQVDYFVDEEGTFIGSTEVAKLVDRFSSNDDDGRKIILVSGPEGFVKYWAGPKRWVDGREVQGPLGGVLSSLNLKDWQVVKL